jgi:hypothetical protein
MTDPKNLRFSTLPIRNIFLPKFQGLVLGHGCGSTYMAVILSEKRQFYNKKCIFDLLPSSGTFHSILRAITVLSKSQWMQTLQNTFTIILWELSKLK